jgi:GTP-binding protein
MITRKNMVNRIQMAEEKGVPITNYGVTLAYLTGILDRAIKGTIPK